MGKAPSPFSMSLVPFPTGQRAMHPPSLGAAGDIRVSLGLSGFPWPSEDWSRLEEFVATRLTWAAGCGPHQPCVVLTSSKSARKLCPPLPTRTLEGWRKNGVPRAGFQLLLHPTHLARDDGTWNPKADGRPEISPSLKRDAPLSVWNQSHNKGKAFD